MSKQPVSFVSKLTSESSLISSLTTYHLALHTQLHAYETSTFLFKTFPITVFFSFFIMATYLNSTLWNTISRLLSSLSLPNRDTGLRDYRKKSLFAPPYFLHSYFSVLRWIMRICTQRYHLLSYSQFSFFRISHHLAAS